MVCITKLCFDYFLYKMIAQYLTVEDKMKGMVGCQWKFEHWWGCKFLSW